MRVIVTRPAGQAIEWTRRLNERGLDAIALPLIGIEPAADLAALRDAWIALAQQRLVVFVSPNAVEHFFAQRPASAAWPATSFAASPGPGTTQALFALGVPRASIIEPAPDAPHFDSESLWVQLGSHDWRAARALIVRGDGGRDWLAEMLRGRGALVTTLAAYRRMPPQFNVEDQALLRAALEAPASHLWSFSSSEAIDNLVKAAGPARWNGACAIATHPRIAARARQAGFTRVVEARPSFEDVVACIQSIEP